MIFIARQHFLVRASFGRRGLVPTLSFHEVVIAVKSRQFSFV